jgi:adenine-specific DNA-methyltransferase
VSVIAVEESTRAIELEDAIAYCRDHLKIAAPLESLLGLIELGILPIFWANQRRWLLVCDLEALKPVLKNWNAVGGDQLGATLFSPGSPSRIPLGGGDSIELTSDASNANPAFYPGIRHLSAIATACQSQSTTALFNEPYFPPTRLCTSSPEVLDEARAQVQRTANLEASRASEFANSAYYMGTKRSMLGFLMECLSGTVPTDGIVFDIMSGSGVAAGAFAHRWRTVASDAQEFSQLLAEVQGGGFSRAGAMSVLTDTLLRAQDHAQELAALVGKFLEWEDKIFHRDLTSEMRTEYHKFIQSFPLYAASHRFDEWQPETLVGERQRNASWRPYILFTAYFANIFFGVRQCVEIDSLRFAADGIRDQRARRWVLGALVATVSKVATTYSGHFAQPRIRDWTKIKLSDLASIIEKRTFSVFHEFSMRLLNLADESERVRHAVEVISGPWELALTKAEETLSQQNVTVYLDPPYRREEYSRYYHVLETLVRYRYPSVNGIGRAPSKDRGERFRSEFFTRNRMRMTQALARVISQILAKGWNCAWSYSSASDASVIDVLSHIQNAGKFSVSSYGCPHEHHAQGGRKPRKVTEYLIVLKPRCF